MKPFFKVEEKTKEKKQQNYSCVNCGLSEKCNSPKFGITGKGEKGILIISEFPTKLEDSRGKIGSVSLTFLKTLLKEKGIDFERDCYHAYAVQCTPPLTTKYIKGQFIKVLEASTKNINNCRPRLLNIIDEIKPEKILTLGKTSLHTLLGDRCSGRISLADYTKFIGHIIPDQKIECNIMPFWNPKEIMDDKKIVEQLYARKYLKKFLLKDTFYKHNYESEALYIDNPKDAIEVLKEFHNKPIMAFDYETTGIKPHAKGHKIFCIGISDGMLSYGIPIFNDDTFKRELKRLLISKRVEKYVHNMKFEHQWTKTILGYDVRGWRLDSMIASHILDNTTGTTGLKFQSYVNFGVVGYDDGVDKYLKGKDKKDSNSINTLQEYIDKGYIEELCKYCAIDAHLTYHLCDSQQNKIENDPLLSRGYNLFHDGILALQKVENNGIVIDEDKIEENIQRLNKKITDIEIDINDCDEVKEYEGDFNYNSNKQLQDLLFTKLKYKHLKETKTGYSVDADSLKNIVKIHSSFLCEKIMEISKLKKIRDTYLAGIQRETVNGMLHNFFNLHTVQSYRGSSSAINFQNQPKHDKDAKFFIRSCFKARPGHFIGELDYGQLEVRVASAYSLDANLLLYVIDPEHDMHRDMAMFLFFRNKDDEELKTLDERQHTKNKFVFPQFYGDWYKACAESLWEAITKETKEHLRKNGIRNYDDFEKHVKKGEDKLWLEMFPDYNTWRNKKWKRYTKTGYIDIKTGFRAEGVFRKNQILNFPVQGSGFHMLLFSLIELQKYLEENNMKTKIIGQIHDSIVLDINPEEWPEVKRVAKEIMIDRVQEKWDFLKNILLLVEADIYKTDGSWYDFEKSEEL